MCLRPRFLLLQPLGLWPLPDDAGRRGGSGDAPPNFAKRPTSPCRVAVLSSVASAVFSWRSAQVNGFLIAFYLWAAAVAVGVVFKIVAYFCGDVHLWLWRHFPGLRKGDLRDDEETRVLRG